MDSSSEHHLFTLQWQGDAQGELLLLDQTRLPLEVAILNCRTAEDVFAAIQRLSVRGAPAIGVAAAYGMVLGLQPYHKSSPDEFMQQVELVGKYLASSRPTAVNLFWAIDRMTTTARRDPTASPSQRLDTLLAEARRIETEDQAMCLAIGRHGATLLDDGMGVLTHCNAGGLATAGDGTALSVFFAAAREGKRLHVFADETRPLLQGARLTTWELMQRGIDTTLICDSMAGWVMQEGKIQAVVTGADRIAANGDAANKIGTYSVALLAQAHGIPFYVAAPSSTFDLSLASGQEIPIEERAAEEVTEGCGRRTAPLGVNVYSPAFDVTPARLITALITEKGIIQPVNRERIADMLEPVS